MIRTLVTLGQTLKNLPSERCVLAPVFGSF
jgi:hypothetical protein